MREIHRQLRNKWQGMREILHFTNWLELLLGLTLFRRTQVQIYRLGRHQFLCDHAQGDENSIRAAVATPMYHQLLADIPVDRPLTVLDIGANAGGFVALLLARGHQLQQVWSVEMNPYTFQRLAFNLGHNLGAKGKAYQLALSGQDAYLETELGKGSTSDSLFGGAKGGEVVRIRVLTFDTFWKEHVNLDRIDLCKIDIEGAEYEMILDGAAGLLTRCRRCIIEVHPRMGRSRQELAAAFERLGFRQTAGRNDISEGTVIWAWVNERLVD